MVSGWVGANSVFCYLLWLRHAKDTKLFVINQMSSWQPPQRLWEEIQGLALAQANFSAWCGLLIDLASSLLKRELCWTGGCAVTVNVSETAGTLAACLHPSTWTQRSYGEGRRRGMLETRESRTVMVKVFNSVSGHQTCLSVIKVLNWQCTSTQCSKG